MKLPKINYQKYLTVEQIEWFMNRFNYLYEICDDSEQKLKWLALANKYQKFLEERQ